jgi:type I restriction enzyme S subunit
MSEVAHIPQLRFPEFDGVWESGLLKDAVKINPRSGELPDEFIYIDLESVKKGYLIKGTQINKIGAPSRAQRLLNKNDVIFQTVRPYQKNNYFFNLDGDYVASTGYAQLRVLNSPEFLYQALHTDRFVYDVMARSTGTSYPAINSTDLSKIKLNLPTKLEQQKIASFLTTVDNKIEQLSKKQALLGEYKKGLMQQIFSQAIRFKADDDSEFLDWEEKRLGNLCEITTGKLDANAMVEGGQYRFYTCAKEYYKIADYAFDTDALIVSGNGANVGYIHHYQGKFNAYQRTYVLDSFTDNIIFVKFVLDEYLHKRIMKEKNDGNTPYIVMGTLTDMKINLPSFSEQAKISNFLSSIDTKIEQVGKQLRESKQFKKALLQQMFV